MFFKGPADFGDVEDDESNNDNKNGNKPQYSTLVKIIQKEYKWE